MLLLSATPLQGQQGFPKLDTTSAVAFFDFKEVFRDSMGNVPDGIARGSQLIDDMLCNPNSALGMISSAGHVEFPDDDALDLEESFSLSFWIYLDNLPASELPIIYKGDPESPGTGSYWVSIYPGDEEAPSGTPWSFSFTGADGLVKTFRSEWGFITGSWAYYTITFDGSMVLMYLASEPVLEMEVSPSSTIQPNDQPLFIGNSNPDGFNGKLDDVILYDRIVQVEELETYWHQTILWPDTDRPLFEVVIGDELELVSIHEGPQLKYQFAMGSEILQDGNDSILQLRIDSEEDFGIYSCKAYNCQESHTKYFDVVLGSGSEGLRILEQSGDQWAYEASPLSLEVLPSGDPERCEYQWYLEGQSVIGSLNQLHISSLSPADTGYYYCHVTNGSESVNSDSMKVSLLGPMDYPIPDTSGIRAWYPFRDHFQDITGNTGPGIPNEVQIDTGMFRNPLHAARFSGPGAQMVIGDDPDLDLDGPFSLLLSFQIDTLPSSRESIFFKSDGTSVTPGNYALYLENDGTLAFELTDKSGGIYHLIGRKASTGIWQLMAITYDGSELNLYLEDETVLSNQSSVIELHNNEYPLVFGNVSTDEKSFRVDEFMFLDRALSSQEYEEFRQDHLPQSTAINETRSVCAGDQVSFEPIAYGPYLNYRFLRNGNVLQEGSQSAFNIQVNSETDLGVYQCEVSNGYGKFLLELGLEQGRLHEGVYIYDVPAKEIFFQEGDELNVNFYVNWNLDGLIYEVYHNGEVISDVFRGIYTIESAVPEDQGKYWFVVHNGCERLVSDTVTLYLEGTEFKEYVAQGWDWTGQISGSGSSYFSSIATGPEGSIGLLGHFTAGLRIEGWEGFSSGKEDLFVVRYDENNNFLWSHSMSSTNLKSRGDVAVDSKGQVYVCGSYWESIQIGQHKLITEAAEGSGFIVKYDVSGSLLWVKEITSSRGVRCDHLLIDEADRVYLGGNFNQDLHIEQQDLNSGADAYATAMFLACLDTEGNCAWISHAVTDADMMIGFGLVDMELDPEGNIVTAGTFTGTCDFGNGVNTGPALESPFLVKYNPEGEAQWGAEMESTNGFGEAFDISVDDLGRVFMTGMYLSDIKFDDETIQAESGRMEEIFLGRFTLHGSCTSLSSYGSEGEGGDYGLRYEPNTDSSGYLIGLYGDLLVMGDDTLEAVGDVGQGSAVSTDMFLALLDDEGTPLALKSAGVRSRRHDGEMYIAEDGRLFFAGLNMGDQAKKAGSEGPGIAFIGYRNQSRFQEVEQRNSEIICEGDSIIFGGCWYKDAGTYSYRADNKLSSDTVYVLELSVYVCTSVEETDAASQLRIFPNPASSVLHLSWTKDLKIRDLSLLSITGRVIWQEKVHDGFPSRNHLIELKSIPGGLYFVRARFPEGVISKKVLVLD